MHSAPFVSLAQYVRREPVAVEAIDETSIAEEVPEVRDDVDASEPASTLAQVRRFRASLAEAFEGALAELLADLASTVLARELEIAPCELRALAQRALEFAACDEPIALCAHPDECSTLNALPVRVEPDPALRRGDLHVIVRCGAYDRSLGVRLDDVLRAWNVR